MIRSKTYILQKPNRNLFIQPQQKQVQTKNYGLPTMFEKITRSFTLIKESWNILKKDKELLMFPIFSGILTLVLFASFILPLVFAELYNGAGATLGRPLLYGLLFVFYLLSSVIVIFFNVALVSCAKMRLEGRDPTLKDGFTAAFTHIKKIILWSLINATIGLLIRILGDKLEEKSPFVAAIVTSVLGAAWGILTFFVIPVMIFENKSVLVSIKESGLLMTKTWGERLGASFTMGFAFSMLYLLGAVPFLIGLFIIGSGMAMLIGIIISIFLWIIIATFNSALNGIFIAALYHYTKTGKVEGFQSEEIKNAFASRKN